MDPACFAVLSVQIFFFTLDIFFVYVCVLVLDVVNVRYPLKADVSDFALRVNLFLFLLLFKEYFSDGYGSVCLFDWNFIFL